MKQPKKKLIEVALPLEAINKESAREKSIRHGHPSTLHLWWARRPLAACRAVLFAQLVDDPSSHPDRFPTEEAQEEERKRLFKIIEELVKWENVNNDEVLEKAREEIRKSTGGNPPPVLDPFAGGGSIPLEAQRLGLEAHAGDLNPVAVLINKALIEIPPKFAGRPPVNPERRGEIVDGGWTGARGLAEDVRYYGKWMRDEAEKRIGHLYPKVKLPEQYGGGEATVIAWIWARTVPSPNPACNGAHVPLVRSFWLSKKKGKEAWVEPVVDRANNTYRFEIRRGTPTPEEKKAIDAGTKLGRGAKFRCLLSGEPIPEEHVKNEAKEGRMGARLMAIVAEGPNGRVYLPPTEEHEAIVRRAKPEWTPDLKLSENTRWFSPPVFGLELFSDLFTSRQLVALNTFSDLIGEVRERVRRDAAAAGLIDDGVPFCEGGTGATAYADAVATYLGFSLGKGANLWSSITSWMSDRGALRETFARQAIPMVWDFAEANPFSKSGGNLYMFIQRIADVLEAFSYESLSGRSTQCDATNVRSDVVNTIISTDPPYYDNIGYADLSDFFYIWLRRSLQGIYPDLFSTMLVPKAAELVATPYRFNGSKEKAKRFFEEGLKSAFTHIRKVAHKDYPLTVYYAFKQTESTTAEDSEEETVSSTGWETMLEGLIRSGFAITGTWPMRTESPGRAVARGTNALASSIVLVCRPRPENAPRITRRDFLRALKRELPDALRKLQQGNIAPVDLAQAAIGPGMAVFSRYGKVIESDGTPMRVRTALALINQTLDEFLAEQEGEFDGDTRWAVSWFEQHGMEQGPYGEAETLSVARNTSVSGLVEAGILEAKAGKVRLLKREELKADWDPETDKRSSVWEITQYLIRALETQGERGAAALLRKLGARGDATRDLAYRLYTICERKGWAQEALAYNSLVVAWPEITRLARDESSAEPMQSSLSFD